MGFNYTNGFHDAANAIATSVSTRALTPRVALLMAAICNMIGAFFGKKVADTVGKGIIEPPSGTAGLVVVGAALVGAIGWNMLTWWLGLPSSSSHALIGRLVGAALGYLVMVAILWLFRRVHPGRASRGFRHAQTVWAAAMALGHGLQDASKTACVVMLALTVG